ncbi:hypothetical protein M9H77_17627 [Catharanthus roseus]|uniref:Uncharacterized protein n=1 Tax=Catharanthus roseus TaxID=4058 RepID=A0ACC0B551_CATRO|nr:hypothetical protein M9H77_17627 [Catharanthus roseus]
MRAQRLSSFQNRLFYIVKLATETAGKITGSTVSADPNSPYFISTLDNPSNSNLHGKFATANHVAVMDDESKVEEKGIAMTATKGSLNRSNLRELAQEVVKFFKKRNSAKGMSDSRRGGLVWVKQVTRSIILST